MHLSPAAVIAAGDVAVAHKWWEDALEKASANAYDQFMVDAGLEVCARLLSTPPQCGSTHNTSLTARSQEYLLRHYIERYCEYCRGLELDVHPC